VARDERESGVKRRYKFVILFAMFAVFLGPFPLVPFLVWKAQGMCDADCSVHSQLLGVMFAILLVFGIVGGLIWALGPKKPRTMTD
jgi:hypothetical protein